MGGEKNMLTDGFVGSAHRGRLGGLADARGAQGRDIDVVGEARIQVREGVGGLGGIGDRNLLPSAARLTEVDAVT